MNPVWGVGCIHRRDTLPRYTACHTRKVHTRSYAATQINYIHRLEYCHRKPEVSVTTRIAPIPTFCAGCRVGTPGWGHFPQSHMLPACGYRACRCRDTRLPLPRLNRLTRPLQDRHPFPQSFCPFQHACPLLRSQHLWTITKQPFRGDKRCPVTQHPTRMMYTHDHMLPLIEITSISSNTATANPMSRSPLV